MDDDMHTDQLRAMFSREPSALDIVGPIEEHRVVLNGWQVPFLTVSEDRGGETVYVLLDDRVGLSVPRQQAERVIEFVADCIAVGLGFTSHPSANAEGPRQRSPYRQYHQIGSVEVAPETPGA